MDLLSALDWIVIVRYTPLDESNAWKGSTSRDQINQSYEFVERVVEKNREEIDRFQSFSSDLLKILIQLCESCNKRDILFYFIFGN